MQQQATALFMRQVILASSLAASLLLPVATAQNYRKEAEWGDMCSDASSQSPVNIVTTKMINGGSSAMEEFGHGHKVGPLMWNYQNSTIKATLSNTQATWLVEVETPFDETTVSSYFGDRFRLRSLIFHSPSENTIDGRHYDMEVQLRHARAGDNGGDTQFLVTSVFLKVTTADNSDNPFLAHFWADFPNDTTTRHTMLIGNPYHHFYPPDRSYYAFNGSLTVPPCSPATCIIFEKAGTISARQLEAFRASISHAQSDLLRFQASDSKPPPGVSCANSCPGTDYVWNLTHGMNARSAHHLGIRWVKHVTMLQDRSFLPEIPLLSKSNGWLRLLVTLGLCLLMCCCIVGIVTLIMHGHKGKRRKGRGVDTAWNDPYPMGPYDQMGSYDQMGAYRDPKQLVAYGETSPGVYYQQQHAAAAYPPTMPVYGCGTAPTNSWFPWLHGGQAYAGTDGYAHPGGMYAGYHNYNPMEPIALPQDASPNGAGRLYHH